MWGDGGVEGKKRFVVKVMVWCNGVREGNKRWGVSCFSKMIRGGFSFSTMSKMVES